jgi:hypothetical protein
MDLSGNVSRDTSNNYYTNSEVIYILNFYFVYYRFLYEILL